MNILKLVKLLITTTYSKKRNFIHAIYNKGFRRRVNSHSEACPGYDIPTCFASYIFVQNTQKMKSVSKQYQTSVWGNETNISDERVQITQKMKFVSKQKYQTSI